MTFYWLAEDAYGFMPYRLLFAYLPILLVIGLLLPRTISEVFKRGRTSFAMET